MNKELIRFIRGLYRTNAEIPLHVPIFAGREKEYLSDTIDSTFVSSVGRYVDEFENRLEEYTGASRAVAAVNGTAALHTALYMAGVKTGDLVVTQALTFVATCNVVHHMGAGPILVDVSMESLGLCPTAVNDYLERYASMSPEGYCVHKSDGRRIRAVVPMHTFGHPADLDGLLEVSKRWKLTLVEDAAESLGSFYKGKHTGTLGEYGALSFNGNKVITTGGGGAVLCRDAKDGARAKHVTTTAKVSHPYEFIHDEPGFNYRLPNLNAALGCAQMELLPTFLRRKRRLARAYEEFFENSDYAFVTEPAHATSNYWLNAIICPSARCRDSLLEESNSDGVMTRPIWQLMHRLPMFKDCPRGSLRNSELIESRLVNLPSTPVAGIAGNHA